MQQPNIVYFVCHDLGKHLGVYQPGVLSPTLDRFAAQGVTFTQAYCSSPACSPARGCAMTGQYAHSNGLMGLVNRGWTMPETTQTLVDYLNDAGYETAHFGLQHERQEARANRYQVEGNPDGTREKNCIENALDEAIAFLESRVDADRPFYCNIGTIEVHGSAWMGKFEPQDRVPVYGVDPPEHVTVPEYLPDFPPLRRYMGHFQGAIRYMDTQISRLFAAVDRLGYRENTLVVFTTDHGVMGERCKTTLYDHGVEISLLMQWPGVLPAGMVVDDLAPNIDLVPTLLEAAGVPVPVAVQGRSLWPRLIDADYTPHPYIFMERNYHGGGYDPVRAIKTPRYHYIRHFEEGLRAWLPHEVTQMTDTVTENGWLNQLWPEKTQPRPAEHLYDGSSDPHETIDLAQHGDYRELKNDLARTLDGWMIDTEDPLLNGPVPGPW